MEALRAALRVEIHRELRRRAPAHTSKLHVALEHVHMSQKSEMSPEEAAAIPLDSLLSGRPFMQAPGEGADEPGEGADEPGEGADEPAEASGLGARSIQRDDDGSGSSGSSSRFGAVLSGEGAGQGADKRYAHIAGPADKKILAASPPAEREFATWFGTRNTVAAGREDAVAEKKSESAASAADANDAWNTGPTQAGLGVHTPPKVMHSADALAPHPRLPAEAEHSWGALEAAHTPTFAQAAKSKELPWSFAQTLKDPASASVVDAEDEEEPADAVGWTFEGVGRPPQPAVPSGCDEECVEAQEAARVAAERLAAEHKEAADLVAVNLFYSVYLLYWGTAEKVQMLTLQALGRWL